jgi:cyanophycinase
VRGVASALALLALVLALGLPLQARPASERRPTVSRAGPGWRWWCRGNPADVTPSPRPGLLLAGGGEDQDEAFRWLDEHASGGDVVVLRASGSDAYDEYIDGLGRVDSVETLLIADPRGAADPFVVERVRRAEAIFVAGGDQWNYLRMWKGKPLGRVLQKAVDRGVPLGGTSAGLAILGEYVFTAEHDTIDSPSALADPHDPRVTIDGFLRLPALTGVITDTHFAVRDRMGRLLAFMGRVLARGAARVRAAGVDEATAVLVEGDARGRVVGRGAAWFLQALGPVADRRPLLLTDVSVERVDSGSTFDLRAWRGKGRRYVLDVENGVVRRRGGGSVY